VRRPTSSETSSPLGRNGTSDRQGTSSNSSQWRGRTTEESRRLSVAIVPSSSRSVTATQSSGRGFAVIGGGGRRSRCRPAVRLRWPAWTSWRRLARYGCRTAQHDPRPTPDERLQRVLGGEPGSELVHHLVGADPAARRFGGGPGQELLEGHGHEGSPYGVRPDAFPCNVKRSSPGVQAVPALGASPTGAFSVLCSGSWRPSLRTSSRR
jgi:hypothetical protein